MSTSAAIARPYAKAVFATAQDDDSGASWRKALAELNNALASESLCTLINDPRVEQSVLGDVLTDVLMKKGFDKKQVNLVQLLAENKRLGIFNEVESIFNQMLDAHQQKKHCNVLSAVELSAEQKSITANALSKKFGGEVDIMYKVDTTLLGGLRIEMDDKVIDDTLLRRIKQLESDILQ